MTDTNQFGPVEVHVPAPIGPCPACWNDAQGDIESGVIVVYCPHMKAGAFWKPHEQRWRIDVPVERDVYFASVARGSEGSRSISSGRGPDLFHGVAFNLRDLEGVRG